MGRTIISFTSHIGRLLDREHDGAGDRLGRQRELVARVFELRFHLWICHAFCEVRVHEPRRNDRHAQFLAGLHPQALGDRAHGELRGGIDRLVRHRLMSGGRSGVDEMSETLLAKDRQRGGDSVKNTFDVDVDHVFPIFNPQVIHRRYRHDAGVVDENVELAVAVKREANETS